MKYALEAVSSHREAFNMLCGVEIGSGSSRQVFSTELIPNAVVKVEQNACSFQNIKEWEIWKAVGKIKGVYQWFAPCLHISPSGNLLVMARTTIAPASAFPSRMPAYFTDLKRQNFGMLEGRLVCHDYGVNRIIERGVSVSKIKAQWWDE